jgi:hypothetical protein
MNSTVVGLVALGVGGLVALLVVSSVAAARRERERREKLAQWAALRGWAFTLKPSVAWTNRVAGRNRHGVTLALSGVVDGLPVSVAEYHYTETHSTTSVNAEGRSTSSSSSTTRHYVVATVRLPHPLPTVTVAPRGALSRMARSVLGPGETSTGQADFDRAFRIKTDQPDLVRAWCTPALQTAHLTGQIPAWSLARGELLCSTAGRINDPETIPTMIAPALRVAALLTPARA